MTLDLKDSSDAAFKFQIFSGDFNIFPKVPIMDGKYFILIFNAKYLCDYKASLCFNKYKTIMIIYDSLCVFHIVSFDI